MTPQDQTDLNTLCTQIPNLLHGQTTTTKITLGKTSWHKIKITRSDRYTINNAEYTTQITEQHNHLTPEQTTTLLQSIPERHNPTPTLEKLPTETLCETYHTIKKILKTRNNHKPTQKKHKPTTP
jgi:hypothetical protein